MFKAALPKGPSLETHSLGASSIQFVWKAVRVPDLQRIHRQTFEDCDAQATGSAQINR